MNVLLLLLLGCVLLLLCGLSVAALIKLRARPWRLKLFPALAPFVQALMILLSCLVFVSSTHRLAGDFVAFASIAVGFVCVAADAALLKSALEAAEAELSASRMRAASEQLEAQRLHVEWAEGEVCRADSVRGQIAADLREARSGLDRGDEAGMRSGLLSAERRMSCRGPVCEHLEANVLLELKRRECEEAGVRCLLDVQLPSDVGVPALDVCSLLSNMVDNALRAASRAKGDARFVEVKARCAFGLLTASVRNGLAEEAASAAALQETASRRRVDGHGWGTGILEELAGKYGGRFESKRCGDEWRAEAVLELPL